MKEQLTKLLLDAKTILDSYGVAFWLDSGTLLGAVRENDFIPWEKDIDLGIWNLTDDVKIKIALEFESRGYKVLNTTSHMNIIDNDIWLDVVYYEQRGEDAVVPLVVLADNFVGRYLGYVRTILSAPRHYNDVSTLAALICGPCSLIPLKVRERIIRVIKKLLDAVGYSIWLVPAKYFNELAKIKLNGTEFNVPAHPEKYLAWRYGKDWITPQQEWTDKAKVRVK